MVRYFVWVAVFLVGCAGGQRVAPPVIDGTSQADPMDSVRSNERRAPSAPAASVPEPATQPLETPSQTIEIAKIEPPTSGPVAIDPAVLELLATADDQKMAGNNAGAAATLERALRLAPRETEVYYQYARLKLDTGDAAGAEQLAMKAVDLAPDGFIRRDSWNLVALAREAKGDQAGAQAARAQARGN